MIPEIFPRFLIARLNQFNAHAVGARAVEKIFYSRDRYAKPLGHQTTDTGHRQFNLLLSYLMYRMEEPPGHKNHSLK